MCASNSSGVVSRSVPLPVSPAALTRLSTRPISTVTAATQARAWATSLTSACTNSALVPASVSSAAIASPGSRRRPAIATSAPSRAAARAMPAPSPAVPPVISTTRSRSRAYGPVPWGAVTTTSGYSMR